MKTKTPTTKLPKQATKKAIADARAKGIDVLDAVIRVSQQGGREGDTFMSPDEQRDKIRSGELQGKYVIDRWIDETASVSGRGSNFDKREGLQLALKRALSGETDGIAVARVNRFARSVSAGLTAVKELHEAGRRFVAVEEGIDGDHSTPIGKLMLAMLFAMAEWQLDTLTEAWKDTRARHIARGVPTKESYGYRKPSPGMPLEVDDEEAMYVRKAFELRADGATWPAIAAYLNDHGAKTRGRAVGWRPQAVRDLLASRVYIGEISSGEHVNRHAHEAIIGLELFEAVQSKIAPGKRGERQYALTGIIRCASCGAPMFGAVQHKRAKDGSEIRYYRCTALRSWGKCDAPVSVPAPAIEAFVMSEWRAAYLSEGAVEIDGFDGTQSSIADAQQAVEDAKAAVRSYLRDPAVMKLKGIDPDGWSEGLDAFSDAVLLAEEALTEARRQKHGVALPVDIELHLEQLDVTELNQLYLDTIECVAVKSAGRQGSGRIAMIDRARFWSRGEVSAPVYDANVCTPIDIGQQP